MVGRYFSPDDSKQQVWLHRTCREKWLQELRGPKTKKGPLKELPSELVARLKKLDEQRWTKWQKQFAEPVPKLPRDLKA